MKTTIENKEWEIVPIKVKDLKPNPDNPRTITAEAFARLKRKIKRTGFRSVIQIDNDGIILGGNQRYHALMEMGYADAIIPVLHPLFKMTEKERQEVIVTDNVPDGDFNNEILANLYNVNDLLEWGLDVPWKEQPINEENPEQNEFDTETAKVKISFYYKDSHTVIDKFLREMKEKYPELMFEVEIDD